MQELVILLRQSRIRGNNDFFSPRPTCIPFHHRYRSSKLHNLGGVGEIRTHGTLTGTTPFQGVTIGHSVTTPFIQYQ